MKNGGRKRDDEGSTQRPKPEYRDPSEKEKRREEGWGVPEGRGDGHGAPEERLERGGKHAPPPIDGSGTRSRRVPGYCRGLSWLRSHSPCMRNEQSRNNLTSRFLWPSSQFESPHVFPSVPSLPQSVNIVNTEDLFVNR